MAGGLTREGARYRIGPLTTYADAGDIQQWLDVAVPGETFAYAIGPALGEKAVIPALARKLQASGKVRLHRDGSAYVMVACAKADEAKAARTSTAEALLGPVEQRVLAQVRDLAAMGLPMPLYDEFAETCGLSDGEAVRYRLRVLAKAGVVRVFGTSADRVVEIVASGQRTATRRRA